MEFILSNGVKKNVTVKRSKRRSFGLKVKNTGEILVYAPRHYTREEIAAALEKNREWLEKTLGKMQSRLEKAENAERLSEDEMKVLKREATEYFTRRTEYFAGIMGVNYGKITVKGQKTRWGSCSVKGNLNFNYSLMLAPEHIRDSVILHELCHRTDMNHGKKFREHLRSLVPDDVECRKWLKENGQAIMKRANII